MKTQEAYEQIKELVLNHTFARGQKIVCRDLEERLHMSRTPIINALSKLEQEEYVVLKQNRGFYVREIVSGEVAEIFDIREKLEEIAAEFALEKCSKIDLKELKKKLDAYSKYSAVVYDKKRLDLDTEFHMQIAKMGKKNYFSTMVKNFYENLYFKINIVLLSPFIEKFGEEHKLIYEAITEGSLKRAKSLIRIHTRGAKRLVLEQLHR